MALDVATLSLTVDTSDLGRATAELGKVPSVAGKAEAALTKLSGGADKAEAAAGRLGRTFGGLSRGAITQTSFQIQDLAVQMAAGTSATSALSMQLPQLLGGFGAFGAAAGAAVAVGLPLASMFLQGADDAATFDDRLDALAGALGDVDEALALATGGVDALVAEYGRAGAEIEQLVRNLAAIRLDAARTATDALLGDTFSTFTGELHESGNASLDAAAAQARLMDATTTLRRELELTHPAARALADAMIDAETAGNAEEQADALARVAAILNEQRDATGALTVEQQAVLTEVINTENALRRALGLTGALEAATEGAAGAAAGLANAWMSAARAAGVAGAAVGAGVPGVVGLGFPTAWGTPGGGAMDDFPLYHPPASRGSTRTYGSVGGGGGGGAASHREPEISDYDRTIAGLEKERAQIEMTRLEREIDNEVRRAGIDVSTEEGKARAAGIAQRVTEMDTMRTEQAQIQAVNDELSSSFAELWEAGIAGADDFGEALSSLASRLGSLAIQRGFETLITGMNPGGSAVGSFLSSLFTPRAGGGPVSSNRPYLVGERGPELFLPGRSGTIVPNGGFGGGGSIAVHVDIGGARGDREIARLVHASVEHGVARGLRAYDARLPDRVSAINADPRFRG